MSERAPDREASLLERLLWVLYSAASLAGYCAGPESDQRTSRELSRYAASTADEMVEQYTLRYGSGED